MDKNHNGIIPKLLSTALLAALGVYVASALKKRLNGHLRPDHLHPETHKSAKHPI